MGISKMDIVGRISYNCDILFRVIDIQESEKWESGHSVWGRFSPRC